MTEAVFPKTESQYIADKQDAQQLKTKQVELEGSKQIVSQERKDVLRNAKVGTQPVLQRFSFPLY